MLSAESGRLRRLSGEGAWILLGQAATVAGALVLVRVLTEHLDPAVYGELALGLTVAGLLQQVVLGGVTAGASRFYAVAAERGDLGGYRLGAARLLGLAAAAILTGGVLVTGGLWLSGLEAWAGLAAAASLLALLTGTNGVLNAVQNAARRRPVVALHQSLESWLKIALALAAVLWLGAGATPVVLGYAAAAALVLASQLVFLRRTVPASAPVASGDGRWLREIWLYCWPFSAWGVFTWMQQASDRWSLEAFASTGEVGLYAVVFQLGYVPATLLLSMAMAFLGPIFFQRSGDAADAERVAGVHRLAWRFLAAALAVTGLAFGAALALHGWLFGFLVSAEYREVSYLLPWVILAGGLFAAAQMLALKLMSEMKTRELLVPKIATALAGVAFNVVGALLAGLHGVVGGLLAFAVCYLLWMLWIGRGGAEPAAALRRDNRGAVPPATTAKEY